MLKGKIADALIKLLETKTLDKITIKEIVEICNTSRQTFYYYFKDIYDIVEWIFLEKSTLILKENSDISNWQYGYIFILNWIYKNKKWILNLYKSINKEYIDIFLYNTLYHKVYREIIQS